MGFLGFLNKLLSGSSHYKYQLVPFQAEDGRGYIIRRLADNQNLNWRGLPRRDGFYALNVAGASQRPKTLQDKAFAPGNQIILKPEPGNPHDPNAVAVYDKTGSLHVGYIYREDAPTILKKLSKKHLCISMWETIGEGRRVGLRILFLEKTALEKTKGLPK